MLNYMRNKLVTVTREDEDTLSVYGVLDDDLYGLWMKVGVSLSGMKIISLEADWNRWTTPECWRAIEPLQEAVGMRIEPGLREKVQRSIGRKACRHFANILLECCHAAREAAGWIRGQDHEKERAEVAAPADLGKEISGPPLRHHEEGDVRKEGNVVMAEPSGGLIIDLHVHTSAGSPCSSAAVDDLIEEAKRIGLDGICLTDHNHVWELGALEDLRQKHGFLILGGNEITTDQGDILVFGLGKEIKGIIKLEELRAEVLAVGGYMIVAHPFRGFLVFNTGQLGLTPEKAMERALFRNVDAIEVLNGKVTESENDFAAEVAQGLGAPGTGGSDAHTVQEVGIYATRFSGIIRNEVDLVEALKGGNYDAVTFRNRQPKEARLKGRAGL
jgi:predicted metal-dependent phosphoesterase TrpH